MPDNLTPPRPIRFSDRAEAMLASRAEEINSRALPGRTINPNVLRVVYRRGASQFSLSAASPMPRESWARARVDAFTSLLRTGRPGNILYTADNDLLPSWHPLHSITASSANVEFGLHCVIKDPSEYDSPEDAILSIVEYSGLGYEAEPAIRAAWIRGINDGTDPFIRALSVAQAGHSSQDADLLPHVEKGF